MNARLTILLCTLVIVGMITLERCERAIDKHDAEFRLKINER